jgi:hypothetical protein
VSVAHMEDQAADRNRSFSHHHGIVRIVHVPVPSTCDGRERGEWPAAHVARVNDRSRRQRPQDARAQQTMGVRDQSTTYRSVFSASLLDTTTLHERPIFITVRLTASNQSRSNVAFFTGSSGGP